MGTETSGSCSAAAGGASLFQAVSAGGDDGRRYAGATFRVTVGDVPGSLQEHAGRKTDERF